MPSDRGAPPAVIPEDPPTRKIQESDSDSDPDCPFCTIISAFPPVDPLTIESTYNSNNDPAWNPAKLDPPAFVILATEDVVAFMDIAPLARGHVLVSPRKHRAKAGDLSPREGAEIGRLLPMIARAVIGTVMPDIPHEEVDYNVVQNNGPGAAQVVPHVHFHIIPRYPFNYTPPPSSARSSDDVSPSNTNMNLSSSPSFSSSSPSQSSASTSRSSHAEHKADDDDNSNTPPAKKSKYEPNPIPTGVRQSYILFGRGARDQLDEEDAAVLAREMRRRIGAEWKQAFDDGGGGSSSNNNNNNSSGASSTRTTSMSNRMSKGDGVPNHTENLAGRAREKSRPRWRRPQEKL